mmetsp:Transcript_24220/g.40579  ORF Transcript_24220/g.40579 Transcript_24220/m.40579 type:complete len:352 (-) Transcript_24220:35-1090(-)
MPAAERRKSLDYVGGDFYKIEDIKRPSSSFVKMDSVPGGYFQQHGRHADFIGSLRSHGANKSSSRRKSSRGSSLGGSVCSSICEEDLRSRISYESLDLNTKPPEFAMDHTFARESERAFKAFARTPKTLAPSGGAIESLAHPSCTSPAPPGPYDKPFKYDLLQGWLNRREWKNPYKMESAKGKLVAIKREQAKLQRDKKKHIDQIISAMYGRDVTHTMDGANHLHCLQRDFATATIEASEAEDEIDKVRKERIEVQKLLIETKHQAMVMEDQRQQLQEERQAMTSNRGKFTKLKQAIAAESQKLDQQLGLLEAERAGLQAERDAAEATHTNLSDARILQASLLCQLQQHPQ